jgi:hypothetical protein
MKRCPESRRAYYHDSLLYCLDDCIALVSIEERARLSLTATRLVFCLGLFLIVAAYRVSPQQAVQNPSPMTDTTRPHPRISQTEVLGRRISLGSLKGTRLFVGPGVNTNKPLPLIVHFHGAPWLIEYHVARHLPSSALITVQLGAGSRAYGTPFAQANVFAALLDEASRELKLKRGWSSITLSGFSAGYSAVRAILRHDENYKSVNNVLLLDGMHASYSPDGKLLADGGSVNAADLDSFVKFARDAVAGRKSFVFTHSEIFPGTFASTTECADYLLKTLDLERKPVLKPGPMGMQQLSVVRRGQLQVLGYAGNTAPDHIDHLHAMPAWLKLFHL